MEQRRGKWNFESRDGGWGWTVSYSDGNKESSSGAFKTLKECADDAAQHGYVAWKAEDERRRDRVLKVTKALGAKALKNSGQARPARLSQLGPPSHQK